MNGSDEWGEEVDIYDKIGWKGLIKVVWKSMPRPFRILALPYGLWTYKKLLTKCSDIRGLRKLHSKKYKDSAMFKLFRPRYSKARLILEDYGIEEGESHHKDKHREHSNEAT